MVARPKKVKRLESTGSLDSWIQMHKAAQRNELVVPGQNIIFSSKRRVIFISSTLVVCDMVHFDPHCSD